MQDSEKDEFLDDALAKDDATNEDIASDEAIDSQIGNEDREVVNDDKSTDDLPAPDTQSDENVPCDDAKDSNSKDKKKKKPKKEKKSKKAKKNATKQEEVADNAEPNEEESTDKKGKKKAKKPMKKSAKIATIVISVILSIAIIATAIAVPIAIANKDKIFVSKEADFEDTSGKYYVLNSNVTIDGDLSLDKIGQIDFNNKILTVNGTLTITGKDSDVILGSIKNAEEKSGGKLQANNIVINADENVRINVPIICDTINIKAPYINVNNVMNIAVGKNVITDGKPSYDVSFEADELVLNDIIEFSESAGHDRHMINIINTAKATINNNVSGSINVINDVADLKSNVNINGSIADNIIANSMTSLSIDANVGGIVNTNNGIAIDKVRLLPNSIVKEIYNVKELHMYEELDAPKVMNNIGEIKFIRVLDRVKYITVDDSNGKMMLEFGSVIGADSYRITIDGEALDDITIDGASSTSITKDITAYVISPNKHTITIVAMSKSNSDLLWESKPMTYEYTTRLQLSKPVISNVAVEEIDNPSFDSNKEISESNKQKVNKYTLYFSKINFADNYTISVNGQTFEVNATTKTSAEDTMEIIDITEYINGGGSYAISVTATSTKDNFTDSVSGMYQFNNYESLWGFNNVSLTNDKNKVYLNFSSISNASYYEIEVLLAGTDTPIIYRTSANKLELDRVKTNESGQKIEVIKSGTTFKIKAVSANPYYSPSVSDVYTYTYQNV